MAYNVIIPCSGPGSRSSSYSKFHKALVRVGKKAVLSHIIDSYPDAETIYIMLGHNGDYIKQYIEHCQYENIKFINIVDWEESQFASLRQIPKRVFSSGIPFYLNSCDNWTTQIPVVSENTAFFCQPKNMEYYDTVNNKAFAGIGYVKDSQMWYDALHNIDATRNDYLIYKKLDSLVHQDLEDWYDVGNTESLNVTQNQFVDDFDLLDKTHQEIYYVNGRVIKLFKEETDLLVDSLTKNQTFPHPHPVLFTDNGLSYKFIKGKTNVSGEDFVDLFDNLNSLWSYCIKNHGPVSAKNMWQTKTYERFDKMIKNYPEFSRPIKINNILVDPVRVLESIDWNLLNSGVSGQCHGDLNLDNIIVHDNGIYYIDHRAGEVTDVFYDICKFYHSLHLNNSVVKNFKILSNDNEYTIDVNLDDPFRRDIFCDSNTYKSNKKKIELGVGCIWLSMAPLNVSDDLNKFLFLYSIRHLYEVINE